MVLEEHRPTPEEILKKIRMIDPDETRVRQGRLKTFSAMRPAWGKPMPCWRLLMSGGGKVWMWLSATSKSMID